MGTVVNGTTYIQSFRFSKIKNQATIDYLKKWIKSNRKLLLVNENYYMFIDLPIGTKISFIHGLSGYGYLIYFVVDKPISFVCANILNLQEDRYGNIIEQFTIFNLPPSTTNSSLYFNVISGTLSDGNGTIISDLIYNYPDDFMFNTPIKLEDFIINSPESPISFAEDTHLFCVDCDGTKNHLIIPKQILSYDSKIFKELSESVFINLLSPLKIGIMIFALLIGLRLIPKIIKDILRGVQ